METLASGGPLRARSREVGQRALGRPGSGPRASRAIWVAIGYAAHVPLALLMSRQPSIGAIHAAASLAVGLVWAISSRYPWRVAYAAAYIMGAEVLWRMTGAPVFWEFAKYAVVLLFLVATLRLGWGKSSRIALAYFALLLPSGLITIAENPLRTAVNNLSFNLSGPLALTASVLFFSRVRVSLTQFRRLLLVGAAPVVGSSVIVWRGVRQATGVAFGQSSLAMSGGFAPNQVSSMLGLAVLLLALYLLTGRSGAFFGAGLLALLLVFATQSAITFSRGGLYLAGISTAMAGAYLLREARYRWRLVLGTSVVAAAAIVVIIPRLLSYTGGAIASRFAQTSTTGRAEIVEADLDTWLGAPIFGVGPGQAKEKRARFFRAEASHTEFTRLLAEHGLFGLAAIACLIALARRAIARPAPPVSRALRGAMLTWSVLFMLIDGVRLAAPGLAFGLCFATLGVGSAVRARTRGSAPAPAAARPGAVPEERGRAFPGSRDLEQESPRT